MTPPSRPDPMRNAGVERSGLAEWALIACLAVVIVVCVAVIVAPVRAHESADLLAAIRAARGDAIPTNATLNRAAEIRADEIALDFRHDVVRLDELLPDDIAWGVVIGWSAFDGAAAVQGTLDRWLASSDHRRTLLSDDYDAVGVGAADRDGRHYFVAIFGDFPADASPTRAPAPTRRPVSGPAAPGVTLPPTDTR